MTFLRHYLPRTLSVLALAAMGAALCAWLLPAENLAVQQQLIGFPDSDANSHLARPFVLTLICFLPALACIVYFLGGTLDRFITRQFLGIFSICLSALFMIWLLFDLGDNLSELRDAEHLFPTLITFYGTRLPAILMLLLPYSLLLALLYSLGKLSTNREIIAMIQSGRGVVRITFPLLIAGLFCTAFTMGLNYQWAPSAEGKRDEILAKSSGKQVTEATEVLYRNPTDRRLWKIGTFPLDYQKGAPLLDIEVTTTGEDGKLASRLFASTAVWDRYSNRWTFENPTIGKYRHGMPPTFKKQDQPLIINTWTETPWQLIKPGLSAENLGIPDLTTWLKAYSRHNQFADPAPYRTQWHYRLALPFTCLVTVLLATPLAIHFSRRGAGGGVFLAVVLSALMLLLSTIILAFGEAGTIPPALAAWLPNIAFTLLGAYLFRRRITGKPIYHTLRKIMPIGD